MFIFYFTLFLSISGFYLSTFSPSHIFPPYDYQSSEIRKQHSPRTPFTVQKTDTNCCFQKICLASVLSGARIKAERLFVSIESVTKWQCFSLESPVMASFCAYQSAFFWSWKLELPLSSSTLPVYLPPQLLHYGSSPHHRVIRIACSAGRQTRQHKHASVL